MTALFADTFYWIALTDTTDSAHESALAITAERAGSSVVTTDEVLAEHLTFFSTSPEQMRRQAAGSVQDLLDLCAAFEIRLVVDSRPNRSQEAFVVV